MALDLNGRKIVVEGLDPSETPMISPPGRSRWQAEDAEELSTSKLGQILSTIQTKLVDLNEANGVSEVGQTSDALVEKDVNTKPKVDIQKIENGKVHVSSTDASKRNSIAGGRVVSNNQAVGATKSSTTSASLRKSLSVMSTPSKPKTALTASPSSSAASAAPSARSIARANSETVRTPTSKTPIGNKTALSHNSVTKTATTSTPGTNPRDYLRRSMSSVPTATSSSAIKQQEKAPIQSLGRKSLSTSSPMTGTKASTFGSSSSSSNYNNSNNNTTSSVAGSVAKRKMSESSDGDSVMSGLSRSTAGSRIPSRSTTPNKTTSSSMSRQQLLSPAASRTTTTTPASASSSYKTPSKVAASPRNSLSTAKNLSGSFSDAAINGSRTSRTPVKPATPKFSHHSHGDSSLTRKTSFGSVGSMSSAAPSVMSTVSTASKSRRSSIGGNNNSLSKSTTTVVKPQKSIDELDEIYSTSNVVSSLKAQKIPSAQLLRTTIQRVDTISVPHTTNPLRRNSLSQQSQNNSNNNSFASVTRRDSKSDVTMDRNVSSKATPDAGKRSSSSNNQQGTTTDNFGIEIKYVEADDDDEHFESPPSSKNGSLQDLKPLGKPPSATNLLGVKTSTPRANPFAHRKSYMMPQTPDALNDVTRQSFSEGQLMMVSTTAQAGQDDDDLLSMFVNSTDVHEPEQQYPSPPAPPLSTRSKSSSLRFRDSPRKSTFPPPYPTKVLYPQTNNVLEKSAYMPPLTHSTPAAIHAIYRAAIAKEAATSQTMLGRISSFRK